jgi:hypothetical protein
MVSGSLVVGEGGEAMRTRGWTAEELETFMAGGWFSGMPYSPERIEEMREELRRQLRERDEARER